MVLHVSRPIVFVRLFLSKASICSDSLPAPFGYDDKASKARFSLSYFCDLSTWC